MDDLKCVRCKACDRKFAPVWHEDRRQWEDMCWDCLSISLGYTPEENIDDIATIIQTYQETEGVDYNGEYE
jgi:hypothetical protein